LQGEGEDWPGGALPILNYPILQVLLERGEGEVLNEGTVFLQNSRL
jgi:hypothetical protein